MRRLSLALLLATALAVAAFAATAVAATFAGAWTKTISTGPAQLHGRWVLQAGSGKFWIQHGTSAKHLVDGSVVASGSTLTFTDRSGALACKGSSAVGRYTRKVDATHHLHLTAVHDSCAGRRLLLTSGAWTAARG